MPSSRESSSADLSSTDRPGSLSASRSPGFPSTSRPSSNSSSVTWPDLLAADRTDGDLAESLEDVGQVARQGPAPATASVSSPRVASPTRSLKTCCAMPRLASAGSEASVAKRRRPASLRTSWLTVNSSSPSTPALWAVPMASSSCPVSATSASAEAPRRSISRSPRGRRGTARPRVPDARRRPWTLRRSCRPASWPGCRRHGEARRRRSCGRPRSGRGRAR